MTSISGSVIAEKSVTSVAMMWGNQAAEKHREVLLQHLQSPLAVNKLIRIKVRSRNASGH
jgi:hypothetical protein